MSGTNPIVPQGVLNRLRASITLPGFPNLTITSSFLGKEGIQLAFRGESTVQLDQMTGIVRSPEPYLGVTVTAHLLRTQSFAQGWRAQMEQSTLLPGGIIVRPDSRAMVPYYFDECSIMGVGDQPFNGSNADFLIRLGGRYQINAALFNS